MGDVERYKLYNEKYDNLERAVINEIENEEEKLSKLFGYYGVIVGNCVREKNVGGIYYYFDKYVETVNNIIKINPTEEFNMTQLLGVVARNVGEKCLEIDVIDDGEYHEENLDLPFYFYNKSVEFFTKCLSNKHKQNVATALSNLSKTYALLGECYNYKGDRNSLEKYVNLAIKKAEEAYEFWITVCNDEYKNANCLYELVKLLSYYNWAFDKETGAKMTIRARDILKSILEKYPNDSKFIKKYEKLVNYVNEFYSEYDN